CELTNILPLSQSTVSGHLRVLKDSNLLEYRKEKLWVEYDLNDHDAVEKEILELVIKKLDGDPLMYEDRERALTVDRNQILCKK
ncbi:MAG: helix-turn-helix transcriptional regulator, partial [bacterium]|nr:helix-turn-helix transcriptional regulator [bacterium]